MSDELTLGTYRAVVVNNNDPSSAARVTLKIPQILGDAQSNWAVPAVPTSFIPAPGDMLWVTFEGGDVTHPIYTPPGLLQLSEAIEGLDGTTFIGSPPKPPSALEVSNATRVSPEGVTKCLVGLSWVAPTENQDGSVPIKRLNGYRVQYSYDGVNWTGGAFTDETSWLLDNLVPATVVHLRVQSLSATSGPGNWVTADTTTSDVANPDGPSTPAATGTLNGVLVTWDGKSGTNAAMPAGFSHVEIQRAPTAAFAVTTVVGTLKQQGQFFDKSAGIGTEYYYRLVAVGLSPNARSAPSAATAATGLDDGRFATQAATITGIQTTLTGVQGQVDGKSSVYVQGTQPHDSNLASDTGDVWIDTANNRVIKTYNGTDWVVSDDTRLATALSTAQSKITTFYGSSTPSATAIGDLWLDSGNGNKLMRATATGTGSWVAVPDSAIATAQTTANNAATAASNAQTTANTALTTANGKNKVTFATSTPGTTANTVGDIWFQTDGAGLILAQWEGAGGTTWVAKTLSHEIISSVDAGTITVGLLRGEQIDAQAISAHHFTAVIAMVSRLCSSTTGQRWEADGAGIRLYGWDDTILINFPTDPNTPASFYGDLFASSLTVQDQLAIRGLVNEISKGSQLVLAGGTTAPTSPPTVTIDWEQFDTGFAPPYEAFDINRYGWVRWTKTGFSEKWWTAQNTYNADASITSYNDDGTHTAFGGDFFVTGMQYAVGLTVIGTDIYVLGKVYSDYFNFKWRVLGYNAAGTKISDWEWVRPANGSDPTIWNNGTYVMISWVQEDTHRLQWRPYNKATGAAIAAATVLTMVMSAGATPIAAHYTPGDFGSNRLIVTLDGVATAYSFDGTGVAQPNENFPLPSSNTKGIGFYNGVFWTHDPAGAILTKHTDIRWTTESSTWWLSNTWYDGDNLPLTTVNVSNKALTSNVATLTTSTAHGFNVGDIVVVSGVDATFNGTWTVATTPTSTTFTFAKTNANVTSAAATGTVGVASGPHETAQGPRKSFTMKKRARLKLTTGILPVRPVPNTTDDAKATRVYMGRGAVDPGRTYMERVATLPDAERNLTVTSLTLPAGAAVSPPPATSDFPASSPGKITSADGTTLVLQGDGYATLGTLNVGLNGGTTLTKAIDIEVGDATKDVQRNMHWSRLRSLGVYEAYSYMYGGTGGSSGLSTIVRKDGTETNRLQIESGGMINAISGTAKADFGVDGVSLGRGASSGSDGYAQITANSTTNTTGTTSFNVAGLSIAFTALAGRRYKITAHGMLFSNVANDQATIQIKDGATAIQNQFGTNMVTASRGYSHTAIWVGTLSAGAHTLQVGIARVSGTGSINVSASSSQPAFILVEDIGAA